MTSNNTSKDFTDWFNQICKDFQSPKEWVKEGVKEWMSENYGNYTIEKKSNNPCEYCSNNPKNNPHASGICHCILGMPRITC